MSIKILHPGLLTTIQDIGRLGHRQEGIIVSGPMDNLALRIANLLVSNPAEAAVLEITLSGPRILFENNHVMALTGANLSPRINGKPIKMWRPIYVSAGSMLEFGKRILGCRTYLALAGGFNIPKILGSYSTYLRAGIGGIHGKALQTGDNIPGYQPAALLTNFLQEHAKKSALNGFSEATWTLNPSFYPSIQPNPEIRVVKGPEYVWFSPEAHQAFWKELFRVTPQSDRMGYRLQGPDLPQLKEKELLSTAVTFGTVQVPAQGNPIILMADHQTTGGYPRIGQVISVDFPILAQVAPGESIRFKEITLPEAQQLLLDQEKKIELLKQIILLKLKN